MLKSSMSKRFNFSLPLSGGKVSFQLAVFLLRLDPWECSTRQFICPSPLTQASRKRWKRCHQELCTPSHRQLHSNIVCSSTQLINTIILCSLLHNSWQNIHHNSSNSAWHWSKTANWVLRSSLSQRTPCGRRSARSSSQTSWTDFSEFLKSPGFT